MTTPADPAVSPVAIRARVRDAVDAAWRVAVEEGALPAVEGGATAPAVEIERPANAAFGDLATNLAMKLARPLPPTRRWTSRSGSPRRSRAGDGEPADRRCRGRRAPGFLNLRVADAAYEALVAGILAAPAAVGPHPRGQSARGQRRVRVGQPDRAADRRQRARRLRRRPAVPRPRGRRPDGDARVLLQRLGRARSTHLGASVVALRRGEPVPEDGYKGAYVEDLARDAPGRRRGRPRRPTARTPARGRRRVGERARPRGHRGEPRAARRPLRRLEERGVASTTRAGSSARSSACASGGHVYEQDGAIWFRSTAFGDDKDRVIYRSDGAPTYFAADIGYVTEKFSRGFDHLIYIWGADHHGTVARVRNAAEAMGYDRDAVQMLLYRWVRFVARRRGGLDVASGPATFITLDELLGRGRRRRRPLVLRLTRGARRAIDFDIELAKKQSNENPVYYVQYAHARIASILRKAAEAGLAPGGRRRRARSPASPRRRWPRVVARLPGGRRGRGPRRGDAGRSPPTRPSSRRRSTPSTATRGSWTRTSRSARRSGWRSRQATRITLANALGLLGISAPESM